MRERPGNNSKIDAGVTALPEIKINKPGPIEVADIMPQYPGGIKALLDFLKKNLHAPEDNNRRGRGVSKNKICCKL